MLTNTKVSEGNNPTSFSSSLPSFNTPLVVISFENSKRGRRGKAGLVFKKHRMALGEKSFRTGRSTFFWNGTMAGDEQGLIAGETGS